MAGRVNSTITAFLACLFFALSLAPCLANDKPSADSWKPLIKRLVKDGEDEAYIQDLFTRINMSPDPRIMAKKVSHKESRLNYGAFLKEKNISMAKEFHERHAVILEKIEKQYGVDQEIMVAILLVETKLGTYLGNSNSFKILANMAITDHFDKVAYLFPVKNMMPSEKKRIKRKVKKKASWAYEELKGLLIYARKNNIDPLSLRSSIFGAIGICQFMPSNALLFGVDHNEDGIVNLFTMQDALASMANYLKGHGWKDGLSINGKKDVLLSYNYSRPYVDTIIEVAKRLEYEKKTRSQRRNNRPH